MKNKKLPKKIVAVLIINVTIAAVFAACTDKKNDDTTTTTTATTATTTDGENAPVQGGVETTTRIQPNLPDYDWGGYTFRVLTADWGPQAEIWTSRDIVAEAETGDPLNDAV